MKIIIQGQLGESIADVADMADQVYKALPDVFKYQAAYLFVELNGRRVQAEMRPSVTVQSWYSSAPAIPEAE